MIRRLIFLLAFCQTSLALDNGAALKPPMGWLSWAKFLCQVDCVKHPLTCINEQLYVDMADKMVEEGYLEAGYEFVNIDDCWLEMNRDVSSQKLVADKKRFPHGIAWLAEYMHQKGLKLGIYEDFGTKTCAGYPGSLNYLQVDAQTFASWNVDMLKLDGCYASPSIMPAGYPKMGRYLNATGRKIVYSCSWPAYEVQSGTSPNYKAIAKACNLWRNYDDIAISWDSIESIIKWYEDHQDEMIPVHGPGQWNDPDMIIVGNPELSIDQSRAQMAVWSIWSAPLLMSNDLRFVSPAHKEILLNKKVIAVDQDPLGIMGRVIVRLPLISIYVKPMMPYNETTNSYSYAVVFLNKHKKDKAYITVQKLSELGLENPKGYQVQDLFTNQYHGVRLPNSTFSCIVNPTGVVMIKATRIN